MASARPAGSPRADQAGVLFGRLLAQNADIVIVAGVVLIIIMLVLPLPPPLLDVLLATNISLALLILLMTMNVQQPLQFSIFPTLLLITTLFRLALNISSTRLILLHGYAGHIIQAFGRFVVGGNTIVGFVVFLILVVIQFIVITKGAERVAEVAARFTLDAMPGKQMSIDADLNAGLIDERESRRRRRDIEREADFYGAMDGASKFVKGDAIAGIIIAVINILGGFAIGVGQQGLSLTDAIHRYTLLTVGDGLVSQIPALLISVGTGIIITRAASEQNMGFDMTRQLTAQPKVLGVAAGIIALLGITPGMPALPFLTLAALVGGAGYLLNKHPQTAPEGAESDAKTASPAEDERESVQRLLAVDPLELEIGYNLIPLVDADGGGDLLDRITMIRRQMALDLGFVVPAIRIRDNMQLAPGGYGIRVLGNEVGKGELLINHYLAMEAGIIDHEVEGIATSEPAFGLPALWVAADRREEAELAGYTVVDPPSVLATHLSECIRAHAAELLGRQDVKRLIDSLKEQHSALVDELVPAQLPLGSVQRVLQALLREGVSIRNLVTVLEALADGAAYSKEIDTLVEWVRAALSLQLTMQYTREQGYLPVLTLDPQLEEELREALAPGEPMGPPRLAPERADLFLKRLGSLCEEAAGQGVQAVLLCSPQLRPPVKRLIEKNLPRVPVLSYTEVAGDAQVRSLGMVSLGHAG